MARYFKALPMRFWNNWDTRHIAFRIPIAGLVDDRPAVGPIGPDQIRFWNTGKDFIGLVADNEGSVAITGENRDGKPPLNRMAMTPIP